MAQHSAHAGVQAYQKGNIFCVRMKVDGREIRKSLETSDAKEAEELCRIIYAIQHDQKPAKVPPVVQRILRLEDKIFEHARQALENAIAKRPMLQRDYVKQSKALRDALNRIRELEQQLAGVQAMLAATGRAQMAKLKPIKLSAAIDNYLARNKASKRTQDEYRSQLKALKEYVSDVLVSELAPEQVIDHLEQVLADDTIHYARKSANVILSMLDHATGGMYPKREVALWRKENCREEGRADDDFYWLPASDVERLAKKAKELNGKAGDYWADAIRIQFAIACRPEELPMLLAKNVNLKAATIHIDHVYKDGVLVRALKTPRSKATIPIETAYLPAFKRRCSAGAELLFPIPYDEMELPRRQIKSQSPEANGMGMWIAVRFDKVYLEMLRTAAKAAKLDAGGFDGRTLRRSRGKDLLDAGHSPTKVAAFLRDRPETVYKHYTRFIAQDLEFKKR